MLIIGAINESLIRAIWLERHFICSSWRQCQWLPGILHNYQYSLQYFMALHIDWYITHVSSF